MRSVERFTTRFLCFRNFERQSSNQSTALQATRGTMADARENMAFDDSSVYTRITIEAADDVPVNFTLLCVDGRAIKVMFSKNIVCAEELTLQAAKQENIEPLAAHLFALRGRDGLWIPPGRLVSVSQAENLYFRLRFVCDVAVLGKECPNALTYFFLQVCPVDWLICLIKMFFIQNAFCLISLSFLSVLNLPSGV